METYDIFGGHENTEEACEDALAEIRNHQRTNKNNRMTPLAAQYKVSSMKGMRKSTLPALEVTAGDYDMYREHARSELGDDSCFYSEFHEISPDLYQKLQTPRTGMPTGKRAERLRVAAYASLRDARGDDYAGLTNSWATILMPVGLAFIYTVGDEALPFISLGGTEKGCLALRLAQTAPSFTMGTVSF